MQRKRFFLLLLLLVLLPYIIISFYCQPAADDFAYAASTLYKGYGTSIVRDYYSWNGRYSSNFFVFASPLVLHSFLLYKLIPIVLLGLTYVALYYFAFTLTEHKLDSISLHLISGVILALYVNNAPSFTETFYWYTGAITYQLAIVLLFIYLSMLLEYSRGRFYVNKKFHLLVILVLIPLIMGFNEVIMLIMVVVHLLWVARSFRLKTKNNKALLLILLLVFISAALMLFAPGNATREANFTEYHQLFNSLYMTTLQTGRFMFIWIVQLPFIAATILFVPLRNYLKTSSLFFKNNFNVHPAVVFICLPTVIFLSVFPAYWSMGMLAQHRTLNVAYILFIPLWFLNIHLAMNYLPDKGTELITHWGKYNVVYATVLLLGALLLNNGYAVSTDLVSGRAATFDKEMNERYAVVKAAAKINADEVIVENLSVEVATLSIYDITCDSENWINKCYSDYFKIERVRLKKCD